MSKLRLIKPRTQEKEVENDLRGVGNDPVIRQSAPFSGLTVKGISIKELEPVLRHYHLTVRKSHGEQCHFLTTTSTVDGEHKLQAVTLFTASLSIHQKHHQAHCHLDLVTPLHSMMHQRVTAGNTIKAEECLPRDWKDWQPTENRIGLSVPVQHFLHQAGFNIHVSENITHLTSHQVNEIINTLKTATVHHKKEAV